MKTVVFKGERLLRGKTIFLSASKPSRRLDVFPEGKESELEEGVRCLARAVFAEEGRLVFGAHPSISPLIVDVATEYFPPHWQRGSENPPVSIYQSKLFEGKFPRATLDLERLGYARIERTEVQDKERYNPAIKEEQGIRSLEHMRRRMFEETKPVAMVAAGGMEGVIREARLFLEMSKGNVYFLKTSGGASEELVGHVGVAQWGGRMIPIEDRFGEVDWDTKERPYLPRQPYALLMQKVVRHIAGKAG